MPAVAIRVRRPVRRLATVVVMNPSSRGDSAVVQVDDAFGSRTESRIVVSTPTVFSAKMPK